MAQDESTELSVAEAMRRLKERPSAKNLCLYKVIEAVARFLNLPQVEREFANDICRYFEGYNESYELDEYVMAVFHCLHYWHNYASWAIHATRMRRISQACILFELDRSPVAHLGSKMHKEWFMTSDAIRAKPKFMWNRTEQRWAAELSKSEE